jgi:hypothetical protein
VAQGRNFFGHISVQDTDANRIYVRKLVHGRVNHGFQYRDEVLRRQPSGYGHPDSGVGRAILKHPRRLTETAGMRVAVFGLGAGALAAYVRSQDMMRFYEINPLVIEFAAGPRAHFSFINESPGTIETIPGDARLSLEREWRAGGSQNFDVIVLDAFSSDSVPVHLLTVEAMQLYLANMRDDNGLIVANISNRFLDFRPLMAGLAQRLGLEMKIAFHAGNPPVPIGSVYAVFCRAGHVPAFWGEFDSLPGLPDAGPPIVWTDQHSDIFRLLRTPRPIIRKVEIGPAQGEGEAAAPSAK